MSTFLSGTWSGIPLILTLSSRFTLSAYRAFSLLMVSKAAVLNAGSEESGSSSTLFARSPLYLRRSPKSTTRDFPSADISWEILIL